MADSVKYIPCASCGTQLRDTGQPVLQCWFCAQVFLVGAQKRELIVTGVLARLGHTLIKLMTGGGRP